MTKMYIDRATVEQALEALEGSAGILQHEHVWPGAEKKSRFVITALRTALAQQDEPVEPVGWLQPKTVDAHSRPDLGYETCSKDDYGAFPVYTSPPQRKLAQQAEPVQEPAFHGFMSDDGTQVDVCFSPSAPRRDGTYATAYYTSPPKAEPVAWNWMLDGYPYGQMYYGNPPDADILERAATAGRTVRLLYTSPPKTEPVAWMYKGEPWFDGTRYHDQYEVTTDERLARFKDENARPLYFAP